jgi:tryptophan-rich sensory protein
MLPNIFFKIDKEFYYSLEGPHLPPIVFIIVWTVIYILMSIFNAYYINLYKEKRNNSLIKMFVFIGINYIANILYVPLFFMIQNLFLSFVVCLIVLITICLIALESLIYNKKITLITLPYIIWSIVGTILAILFYLQN